MNWEGQTGNDPRRGCDTCAIPETECKERWDYMRETGGEKVQCWRPPGCLLVWGEEQDNE